MFTNTNVTFYRLAIEMKGNKHIKDEPQHFYQGKITIDQLNLLGIDHIKINNTSNINMTIKRARTWL